MISLALCVVCGSFAAACGRKGPPLAPIVYLPRPVAELAAKRVEDEVVVQFTVPTLNTDGSSPADLRRVEVYAHTGPLPTPADYLKYGTLVSSIDIAQPPQPEPESSAAASAEPSESPGGEDAARPQGDAPVETAQIVPNSADSESKLVEQGWKISVREPLTDKHKEIGPMPPTRPAAALPSSPTAVVVERLETPGTVNFELPPMRFYTVVGVSRSRGRRGPYAGPLRVPLAEPLAPPEQVETAYTEAAISLTWPRQPEDAAIPEPVAAAAGTPAAAAPQTAAPPIAVPPADTVPSDAAPAVTPPGDAPQPTAAPPAVPEAPVTIAQPLQETAGTFELYADLETEGTEDVAPPAPPVTPAGAKAAAAARAAAAAAKAAPPPAPRFGYNVYDASAVAAAVLPGMAPTPGSVQAPGDPLAPVAPLNAALLTTPSFSDPRVEFGVERCYLIRRVQMADGVAIESAPTTPICVTPVDTFPPAPPKNLQAISGGAGVSLLWEANTESDLGGYLVLRGDAPGDKLSPLTPAPISDTSFTDTTVRRGRTYVYEVVAVDSQPTPNQSAPSNRVEETIR